MRKILLASAAMLGATAGTFPAVILVYTPALGGGFRQE